MRHRRTAALLPLALAALVALPWAWAGCDDERSPAADDGACTCDPECPPGVCDLSIELDGTSCSQPAQLVVDGQEVGPLQPGETWSSCRQVWRVGETLRFGVRPGTQPYFPSETWTCSEAVDHVRPTWRCSR